VQVDMRPYTYIALIGFSICAFIVMSLSVMLLRNLKTIPYETQHIRFSYWFQYVCIFLLCV
jgi:hypothetical protein